MTSRSSRSTQASNEVTGAELIACLTGRGLRPFWYPKGPVFVNTRDFAVAWGMRALGALTIRYQPAAISNPDVQAWEINLSSIPCEGNLLEAAREWQRGQAARLAA